MSQRIVQKCSMNGARSAELFGVEAYFQQPDAGIRRMSSFGSATMRTSSALLTVNTHRKAPSRGLGVPCSYGMLMISRRRLSGSRPWALKSMIRLLNAATLALLRPQSLTHSATSWASCITRIMWQYSVRKQHKGATDSAAGVYSDWQDWRIKEGMDSDW